jgi:hypothetical protein
VTLDWYTGVIGTRLDMEGWQDRQGLYRVRIDEDRSGMGWDGRDGMYVGVCRRGGNMRRGWGKEVEGLRWIAGDTHKRREHEEGYEYGWWRWMTGVM